MTEEDDRRAYPSTIKISYVTSENVHLVFLGNFGLAGQMSGCKERNTKTGLSQMKTSPVIENVI